MFNIFKDKRLPQLKDFLRELKSGSRDFFQILQTPETHFVEASFQELFSNAGDVQDGVTRVQKNFRDKYFDLFDGCLIKHYSNKARKIIFYTTTDDAKRIMEIAQNLFDHFGPGLYDDRIHRSFTDTNKIIQLSKGIYLNERDNLLNHWTYDDLSILLQYKTSPLREFSLMITQKLKDTSIRTKGTLLDLLHLRIDEVLQQKESSKSVKGNVDNIQSVDYSFLLNKRELDVFDRVIIRIFDAEKKFRTEVQTDLLLYSSTLIKPEFKINTTNKLITLYGIDDTGQGNIDRFDKEMIQENDSWWPGRCWTFNSVHRLKDAKNNEDKVAYSVRVSDFNFFDNPLRGFNIHVKQYNTLVALFGSHISV